MRNQEKKQKVFVRDVCQEWLCMEKLLVKQSTYAKYCSVVRRHIEPAIGEMSINDLNSSIINRLLEK